MIRRRHPGVMVVGWLLVMLVAGFAIYGHERTLREGEFVLLELAPVDPRSLMQGDYMQLSFAIDRQLADQQRSREVRALPPFAHIHVDEQRRGRFLQLSDLPARESEVVTLRLRRNSGQYSVGPNGYFSRKVRLSAMSRPGGVASGWLTTGTPYWSACMMRHCMSSVLILYHQKSE
ncbi:GDYXXLXY domain-containing protein [Halopseudomonas salegens]|uniref:Uncharacterized membrane-anchored protein n=1 Tax=Halopseudomonas salegens TaxID=1434072 RepID=A0A1H2G502_9GAMM|nr:GDYXXLXY domain-containing protein [Halopseudomonas salegens]SDU14609.1 Uncharacterized membrane-anchored protein [Halopseudomonas salegens]